MAKKTFPCFKCRGTGNIMQFNHYANGVCFQCKGTGKLTDVVLDVDERWLHENGADYALTNMFDGGFAYNNMAYARSWAEECARHLFYLGRERAKEILASIATGTYRSDSTGEKVHLGAAVGRKARDMVVEAGRRLAASVKSDETAT